MRTGWFKKDHVPCCYPVDVCAPPPHAVDDAAAPPSASHVRVAVRVHVAAARDAAAARDPWSQVSIRHHAF
ncbi:hypothetical protein E6O75_ATG01471 [Venturia nashicola]|uniref:Uncharacterized protein n=1 Tax=Venturia nashicola TaxID=86259 RepID=A0A4Z1PC74_9PEZI|nr:hypothetical protein E6O75_ATG01471 [Venturia nashicola]